MTITASPSTIKNAGTSQISVSFNNYTSDGTNYRAFDPALGHIPNGTPVTFNTDKGSIGCKTIDKQTSDRVATATLTADETAGVAHVNAVTDSQTVYTEVNIDQIGTETTADNKNNFAGQNVDLTAQVKDDNGNNVNEGQITFSVNGGVVGTVNVINGQATYTWTIPTTWTAGDYPILADYLGTNNYLTSTDTATLTVMPTSSLYLTITPGKENPVVGDTVTYTLKVGNKGPDPAQDVVMTYTIPEGLEFAGATVDVGTYTYDPATRTITWTIGEVPVGDPYMWLDLKILKAGQYLINPRLSTTTYDPTLNRDTQSLTVNAADKTTPTPQPVHGKTVGMQTTGVPVAALIFAVLLVLGGLVYTKK